MPCLARRSASAARTFPPLNGGKVTAFCFDSISVPSVKYDLTDRLRVPIADLFQFLRTQLTAQATPVLIQLGKVQKPHWNFRQPEPFRLLDQNKSAGSIPLCKGRIGIMDVLQKKDRLVVPAEFGRIEVPIPLGSIISSSFACISCLNDL